MVIQWTEYARENLQYFLENKIAKEYIIALVSYVDYLIENPKLGKFLMVNGEAELRQLVYRRHRIIYCINRENIQIVTVINASQNLEEKIKQLKRLL